MRSIWVAALVLTTINCSGVSENNKEKSTPQNPCCAMDEKPDSSSKLENTLGEGKTDSKVSLDQPEMNAAPVTAKKVDKYKVVKTGSKLSVKDAQAILDYHNKVRADVKVEKMTWSPVLGAWAQQWADALNALGCKFQHRRPNKYGENLYMGSAHAFNGVSGVKAWESEKKYYAGGKLTSQNWYKSGHYTQVVWRKTTEVGCAQTVCKGMMILVCNYNPPGNFMGQKPY